MKLLPIGELKVLFAWIVDGMVEGRGGGMLMVGVYGPIQ